MDRHKFTSTDEFIASFDGETHARLLQIRKKIFELMPDAEEKISYNIPAYFLNGKMIVYMSGYENHVSIYPGRTLSSEYTKLAAAYASGKSTLKFPNSQPLPMDLITEFIKLRIKEVGQK